MAIGRTNSGMAGGIAGVPKFTYTGTYSLLDDGNRNWRLKFLTSGTLTLQKQINADAFYVGGGGGAGSTYSNSASAGGCGGYTLTKSQITLNAAQSYDVIIGAGGIGWATGGTSSAFGFSAAGGAGATDPITMPSANFKGGSGGGQYSGDGGGSGGSDGSNGGAAASGGTGPVGIGQGTTTREFGEATGTLYAGGGGGYYQGTAGAGGGGRGGSSGLPPTNGEENTGGGAGGLYGSDNSISGGSGIVIIRNAR